MQNPLNESQRELLSAYLDGEVSAAEKQTAEELLQREDAQQYLESLRATVKLVTDNAPVRAPVGLSGRVMNSLKDEVKLVDPGSEPFTALPRISWQAPIWAAAAAIAVSVAIMFGPNLFNTKPQGPEIAREVLDNLPTRTTQPDEQIGEKPEGTLVDGVETDGDMREELAARAAGENAKKLGAEFEKLKESALNDLSEDEVQNDPSDSVADKASRRAEGAESEKKGFGNGDTKTTEEREASEGDADSETLRKEGSTASGTGAAEGAKKNGEKSDNNWDGGAGGGRAKAAKSKDEAQGESAPEPQPRRNRDDANEKPEDATARPGNEADDRSLEDNKREARGGVVPPAAPAKEPPVAGPGNEVPKQDAGAIEVKLTEGGMAAQTDVLWISKLYGEAKIADGDEDVESIEVEVDADKLPELMAALRKLANEQGYGTVEGEPALGRVEQPQPEGESARKISGYLPVEEERAQEPNEAAAPAERVKLVIRMK